MIQLYECPECGLQVERLEKSDEDSEPPICSQNLRENEKCGAPWDSAVYVFDKKIGRPNAHFKGSGFHSTDYNDSSNPASNT
jgi:predicted nucleic acid-binding Zn ribbon protein